MFPVADPARVGGRYVVTVTNRRSDLEALTRLDLAIASRVIPSIRLIRLAGRTDRVTARRMRHWASQIRAAVPGSAYYVELTDFDPTIPLVGRAGSGGRRLLLQGLAEALQRDGRLPIPVVRLGAMSERQRNLVVAVAHGSPAGLAVAVGLGPRWVTAADTVDDLLAALYRLRLDPAQTALLLEAPPDRGERLSPADLALVLRRLRAAADWRQLVLLGSGVPSIIPRPGPDERLLAVRRDDRPVLAQLTALLAEAGTELPAFGDYGTRHPLRLGWAGTKRANIRYTTDNETLVAVGDPTRNGAGNAARYAELCQAITDHRLFRGEGHCWACALIAHSADQPDQAPTLQSTWDTAGLVHHITTAVIEP